MIRPRDAIDFDGIPGPFFRFNGIYIHYLVILLTIFHSTALFFRHVLHLSYKIFSYNWNK